MMRSTPVAVLAGACLICLAATAEAQAVNSGLEIQVNPMAAGGSVMLLYPGGQYMRMVPALLPASLAPTPRGGARATTTPRPAAPRPVAPPPRVASVAPKPQPAPPPVTTAPPANNDLLSSLPTISVAPAPGTA